MPVAARPAPRLTEVRGPRLERRLTLHLKGDWGQANLHRVCGWLSQEVVDRSPAGTQVAVWNGRGGVDNVLAVAHGDVDLALATPAAFVAMALDGRGPYCGDALAGLRALATLPQRDRLIVALARDADVSSFEEWRQRRAGLTIATSPDDGVNHIGFAAQRLMETAGIDRRTLEAWGGGYVEDERPFPCLDLLREGRVDGVIQEAIMTPHWQRAASERGLRFLQVEGSVLDRLQREFGWPSATVPAGYFQGLDEELRTLDFSDFLVIVREDMDDEVAGLLTWCLVETRSALEAQYRHLQPERSPVTWPLDPRAMARTAIPLHPAAARCYEELRVPLS